MQKVGHRVPLGAKESESPKSLKKKNESVENR